MGHGTGPAGLNIILLCKELGWTYDEYMNQPYWFVEGMEEVMRLEAKHEEKQAKKQHGR